MVVFSTVKRPNFNFSLFFPSVKRSKLEKGLKRSKIEKKSIFGQKAGVPPGKPEFKREIPI
jgi:hypothetical protein